MIIIRLSMYELKPSAYNTVHAMIDNIIMLPKGISEPKDSVNSTQKKGGFCILLRTKNHVTDS